jgi:hypothetical protein
MAIDRPAAGVPLGLCGAAVGDGLVDVDAEGVGDALEAVEVDTGVGVGLPALDLLLGDADSLGELALSEPRGDAGFDQRGGQLAQRGDLPSGYASVA